MAVTYSQNGVIVKSMHEGPDYGSVVIGGRSYKTIVIGTKEWIVENLDYKFAVNGSQIPIGESGFPILPAAWYYNNDETSYGIDGTYKCGLLYNWYAVDYLETNKASLLPAGWRVSSVSDWSSLIASAEGGDSNYAAYYLKAIRGSVVSGFPAWTGCDKYYFNALPAGIRYGSGFEFFNANANWWTSDQATSPTYVYFDSGNGSHMQSYNKESAFSLRLVRDAT